VANVFGIRGADVMFLIASAIGLALVIGLGVETKQRPLEEISGWYVELPAPAIKYSARAADTVSPGEKVQHDLGRFRRLFQLWNVACLFDNFHSTARDLRGEAIRVADRHQSVLPSPNNQGLRGDAVQPF
jgi:hypothetical protein